MTAGDPEAKVETGAGPVAPEGPDRSPSIESIITSRPRDLGGFAVRRTLPSIQRRMVGPFIFFDHMGPAAFPLGEGIDVRPHPHIGLATVTYLFDGEILHRDSLGSFQPIRPGDVNWMVAGQGIVHSERSSPEARQTGARVHGIQTWVALPLEDEETAPRFEHHDGAALPKVKLDGVSIDVVAGTAFGRRAPTSVLSPTLYAHALLEDGARLTLDEEHEDRAAYVVQGLIACDGQTLCEGTMVVFRPGQPVVIDARGPARVMVVGGAKLSGERHIYWNFVSSSRDRIERAKSDWQDERFPKVSGDEHERVPLPG